MKKKILLFILLLLLALSTGCWDYIEFENMALITGAGIDYDHQSDMVKVTVQYVGNTLDSSGGSKDSSKPLMSSGIVHSATDITIVDALNNLQKAMGKRLFYGYMNVLVINEDAARYILKDIIELASRTPNIRDTANFLVTSGRAEDAISIVNPDITGSYGGGINELVNLSTSSGSAFPVSIKDLEEMLAIGGIEAVSPRLFTIVKREVDKNVSINTRTDGEQSTISFNVQKEGQHKIAGMACFKGDEFAGWLTEKQSRGLGWIAGKKFTTYVSANPGNEDGTKKTMNFLITNSSSSIKVGLVNNKPSFEINIKVKAALRKYMSTENSTVLSPEVISYMERGLESQINSDIQDAIHKGQKELKTDIFKLGYTFFRKHPVLWRKYYKNNWMEIFPTVSIKVNVKASVTNTGINVAEFHVE